MALYHKWDVKNGFAYVFTFFSLISDGLGSVGNKWSEFTRQIFNWQQGKSELEGYFSSVAKVVYRVWCGTWNSNFKRTLIPKCTLERQSWKQTQLLHKKIIQAKGQKDFYLQSKMQMYLNCIQFFSNKKITQISSICRLSQSIFNKNRIFFISLAALQSEKGTFKGEKIAVG